MRIHLQHTKTGLYFQKPGIWIREPQRASDFGDSQKAIDYAQAQHMTGVQVAVVFVDPEFIETIAFPIEPLPAPRRLANPTRS